MSLRWRPKAEVDRERIHNRIIDETGLRAAVTVDTRLTASISRLVRLPALGRPGRAGGTRELTINRTPFFVVYRIEGDTVLILRILHSRREWSADLIDEL